jgi:hypothetical protein
MSRSVDAKSWDLLIALEVPSSVRELYYACREVEDDLEWHGWDCGGISATLHGLRRKGLAEQQAVQRVGLRDPRFRWRRTPLGDRVCAGFIPVGGLAILMHRLAMIGTLRYHGEEGYSTAGANPHPPITPWVEWIVRRDRKDQVPAA